MHKHITAIRSLRGLRRATSKVAVAFGLAFGVLGAAGVRAQVLPAAAPKVVFAGTAYAKTRSSWHYADKTVGPTRMAFDAQIDLCNSMRRSAGLPETRPPESALAALDVTTKEKYFATDRALTLVTGSLLVLTDLRRFLEQSKASPGAAAPPDCALLSVSPIKTGTLWRDGVRYELHFKDGKAFGTRSRTVDAQRTLMPQDEWDHLPRTRLVGQTCREIPPPPVPSPLLPTGKSCIWDLFPFVGYLNWPFALSGDTGLSPTGGLVESIEPIDAWSGRTIDPPTFDVPAGMKVIITDRPG